MPHYHESWRDLRHNHASHLHSIAAVSAVFRHNLWGYDLQSGHYRITPVDEKGAADIPHELGPHEQAIEKSACP